MSFNFVAPFLRRPKTDFTGMDTAGDMATVRRVMQVGGLIFQQVLRDGTGEISLRIKEYHCGACGHVDRFEAVDEEESAEHP